MKKGSVVIIIAIVFAVVIGVIGVLGYQKFLAKPQANEKVNQSVDSTQKTRTSSSPKVNDETANWKTYTNQRYKFSFKYPPPWELAPDIKDAYPEENVIVLLDNYNEITISIRENITDTKEAEGIVCGPPQCGGYKFEDTKIGNLIVRKPEAAALEKAEYGYAVYLLNDNTLYAFFLNTDKSTQDRDIKTLDQILSTFKFD